jgi:DNA end-binding protein Ku
VQNGGSKDQRQRQQTHAGQSIAGGRSSDTVTLRVRSIWNGVISFGLVTIPVRLYTATDSHDVNFHLIHKKDGARLRTVRWCPVDDRAVPWEEVERGYEVAKDTYVPVTDNDLERIPLPTVHAVSISDFVELADVDPIYGDKSYYLAPDAKGEKAFGLLRQALEQTGRAAVAKVAIRERESLCLVRPYKDALALETLFYADEIRDTAELKIPKAGDIKPQELKMAISLIDNLSTEFDPGRYQDTFQEGLKQVIDAKVAGRPVPKPPAAKGQVVDLMEALRASVEASKKGTQQVLTAPAPSPARRTAARRRKTA